MVPLLVVLILGIFEYGFVLRNSSILANSLRSASRSASQAQLDPDSDLFALQTFAASTANLKNVTINRVIIYNAGTANGKPPAACLTVGQRLPALHGHGSPQCNVYDASGHRGGGHGQLHLHGDDRTVVDVGQELGCVPPATAWPVRSTTSGCTPT